MASPYTGLLVDWGGVMTTDVFASFGAFCEREGLSAETVRNLFRSDETSRDLLIGLETGTLPEPDFERPLARPVPSWTGAHAARSHRQSRS